jgi:succinate dehydrogenase / fumarate reductase cytochrome b subunit
MAQIQPRPNFLGIRGWVYGGRYKLERYLYILHRVTGVGLLLFILFHFTATTVFRVQGQGVWEAAMGILKNPFLKVGEYLVVVAFVFHAVNGLRLVLQELGFALGKPIPPIYPYRDAIRKRRPLTIVLMVIIILLAAVALYDFMVGGW